MARSLEQNNKRVAIMLTVFVGCMVGLAFASVPLYRIFCQVTGFGGTTQVADVAPGAIASDRKMTVEFVSNVAPGLPWEFKPEQRRVKVAIGEERIAAYRVTNTSDKPVTGEATFNVTPLKAGSYFSKIECFCFTEQRLEPGESMVMPLSFFVDPDIVENPNLNDVTTITLSYTFFNKNKDGTDSQDTALVVEPLTQESSVENGAL